MPRGRPPGSKNAVTLEKVNILQEEKSVVEEVKIKKVDITEPSVSTEEVAEKPKKEIKVKCYCSLCNSPIYSSPYTARLQELTSKASWHRKTKIETVCMCEKCAKELNTMIDNFIIKKNPSLSKWGIAEEKEENKND